MAMKELTVKSHKWVGRSNRDLCLSVGGGEQVGCSWVQSLDFRLLCPGGTPCRRGSLEGPQAAVLMLLRVRGHDPEVCLKTCINIFYQREHSRSSAKQVCLR